MRFYAERPLRVAWQLLADVLVIAWAYLVVRFAQAAQDLIDQLQGPAGALRSAGQTVRDTFAGRRADGVRDPARGRRPGEGAQRRHRGGRLARAPRASARRSSSTPWGCGRRWRSSRSRRCRSCSCGSTCASATRARRARRWPRGPATSTSSPSARWPTSRPGSCCGWRATRRRRGGATTPPSCATSRRWNCARWGCGRPDPGQSLASTSRTVSGGLPSSSPRVGSTAANSPARLAANRPRNMSATGSGSRLPVLGVGQDRAA